jgi:hypothetical protein
MKKFPFIFIEAELKLRAGSFWAKAAARRFPKCPWVAIAARYQKNRICTGSASSLLFAPGALTQDAAWGA